MQAGVVAVVVVAAAQDGRVVAHDAPDEQQVVEVDGAADALGGVDPTHGDVSCRGKPEYWGLHCGIL